jgi:hypothetical protein
MLIEKNLMRLEFALELHDKNLRDSGPRSGDIMTIERANAYLFGKEVQLHANGG